MSLNCYLIDKKGYRDKIFFQEKGCGFKKYMYFCGVKMTKRNDRFFSSFLHPPNSSSTEIYLQKQHSKNSLIPLSFKNRCFLGKTPMPTVFRKGACPSLTRCLSVCFLKFFGFCLKNLPKSAKSAGAFLNFDDLLSPFRLPVITISF